MIPFGEIAIDAALVGNTTRRIFASSNTLDPHIRDMIMGQEMTSIQYDGSMYVMKPVPELGFTVVAWATLKPLAETWHRQLLLWLPFGILISLLAALFVLRILRRIQSPRNRLLDAINSRDFVVHYQPIVALCSGKIVGAEALTRWPQPDGSSLSPDIFIPLAPLRLPSAALPIPKSARRLSPHSAVRGTLSILMILVRAIPACAICRIWMSTR